MTEKWLRVLLMLGLCGAFALSACDDDEKKTPADTTDMVELGETTDVPDVPQPVCGNGVVEAGEECDGTALAGATCVNLGYAGGALSCSNTCAYDTSLCVAIGSGATCANPYDLTHEVLPFTLQGDYTDDPALGFSCLAVPTNVVWFTYTAATDGAHSFMAENGAAGVATTLVVLTSAVCSPYGAEVACVASDDAQAAQTGVALEEGQTYLIVVATSDGDAMTDPQINVVVEFVPLCGNGDLDEGEVCDGAALDGKTCDDFEGYTGDGLACATDCLSFVTTGCAPASELCGNDTLDTGELCDGTDLDDKTCADFDGFEGEGLACAANCLSFVTDACDVVIAPPECGNDIKEEGEVCDGTDLDQMSCADMGGFVDGDLSCASDCQSFVTTACNPVAGPCAGVTCATPDPATCAGSNLLTYALPGTCQDDTGAAVCHYTENSADCTVVPQPTCDGNDRLTYSNGACTPGTPASCTRTETRTPCGDAFTCTAGACVSKCDGVTCNTPPAAECNNDNSGFITYAATGTCDAASGTAVCTYAPTPTPCDGGTVCIDAACVLPPQEVTFYFSGPSWMDNNPNDPRVCGPFGVGGAWECSTMVWDAGLGWWHVTIAVDDASAEITYQVRFDQDGVTKYQRAVTTCTDPTFTTTTGEIWIDASPDVAGWCAEDNFYLEAAKITEAEPLVTIVGWNFDAVDVTEKRNSTVGTANNIGANAKVVTVVGAGPTYTDVAGVSGKSVSTTNWHGAVATPKYWLAPFDASGFKDLVLVTSYQTASNAGPRDFKLQYSTNGTDWFDVTGGTVLISGSANNWTSGVLNNVALPAALNGQATAYLRWIATSNTALNGSDVTSAGTSRLDEVYIAGVPL